MKRFCLFGIFVVILFTLLNVVCVAESQQELSIVSKSTLSFAELKELTGGQLPSEPVPVDGVPEQYLDGITPPATWDWRDVRGIDWMTRVKHQGGCGSCAAFASCGAVEAMMNLWSNDPDLDMDFSEQHLFNCADGECSSGLYMGDAFDYFTNPGVPDEACFPYQGIDLDCSETCADWQDRATKLDSWSLMWQYGTVNDLLKQAVWWQPIAVYLEVYADFGSYSGGVYKYDGTSPFSGGHFVVIVGWDDSLQCWICKNSWGEGWGENGYFRIAWDEVYIGSWAMDPDLVEPACVHDGDVNGDNMLTAGDAQLAFQATLGTYQVTGFEACRADCNGDDLISASDAQTIFFAVMGTGTCAE